MRARRLHRRRPRRSASRSRPTPWSWPSSAARGRSRSIERVHPRRVDRRTAAGGMWLKIVPEGEPRTPRRRSASGARSARTRSSGRSAGCCSPQFHGRGLGSEALGPADRAPARASRSSTSSTPSPGVTNGPSNGLCRKFGFELVGGESRSEFSRPAAARATTGRLRRLLSLRRSRGPRYSPVSSGIRPACSDSRSPRRSIRRARIVAAEQAGDPEAELDAEHALARPVDVVELEQQRRLVEGEPDPGAERHREGLLEPLALRDQARRRRPRTRSGSRGRSGARGGRRPGRCRSATSRCGCPRWRGA